VASIETLFGLLVAVAALTWLAQRLRIEYPILLVIGGLIIGFIPGLPTIQLSPDVVFLVFLPPLLYYEAFNSSIRDFRANLRLITLNAVFLVIVTIAAVAVVAHALVPGIPWAVAVVLGAILGPTDETAAIAIASRLNVPRRLITIIKAESLFNDATSLVIYNVALVAAVTGAFSWALGLWQLFIDAVGGVCIGLAVGWLVRIIRNHLDDLMLQNTASLLTGYAAYFPADALHLSGVLAAITAGLYLGRSGHTFTSPSSRIQITAQREITLYLINGVLFILIGLQLHPILSTLRAQAHPRNLLMLAIAISLTVILVRIAWAFPAVYLPRILSSRIRASEGSPSWRNVVVASWTGLRGGVSLAAALAVPLTVASGAAFSYRELLLFLTFAVILATLVGQGLTLPALIRALRLTADGDDREETLARLKATRAAYAALNKLAEEPWADKQIVADLRGHLKASLAHHEATRDQRLTQEQRKSAQALYRIRRELAEAQNREIIRLRNEGAINDATMHKIQRELDLQSLEAEAGAP
jgi:CPA1 family monovalent cation:H+ antiporter